MIDLLLWAATHRQDFRLVRFRVAGLPTLLFPECLTIPLYDAVILPRGMRMAYESFQWQQIRQNKPLRITYGDYESPDDMPF